MVSRDVSSNFQKEVGGGHYLNFTENMTRGGGGGAGHAPLLVSCTCHRYMYKVVDSLDDAGKSPF